MFDSQDISADSTSEVTNVRNLDKASVRVVWTGSPVGELIVEARNTEKGLPTEEWYQVNMNAPVVINSTTYPEQNHLLQFFELPFSEIRMRFVSTSGTGTLDATLVAKTVGA
jgi:hypothetical protein